MNRRDVFMPKRNSSDPYVPFLQKDPVVQQKVSVPYDYLKNTGPEFSSLPNNLPNHLSPVPKEQDKNVYSYLSPNQFNAKSIPDARLRDIQQIDLKMQKLKEEQILKYLEKKNAPDIPKPLKSDVNRKNDTFFDAKNEFPRKDIYSGAPKFGLEKEKSLQSLRKDPIRSPDDLFKADKNRFEKLLNNNEAKQSKDTYGNDYESQNFKSYENKSSNYDLNLKKAQIEKNLLNSELFKNKQGYVKSNIQPTLEKYQEDPDLNKPNFEEELKNRLQLIEENRKKSTKFQSPTKLDPIEFEKSMKKFFGVDEDLSPKAKGKISPDPELPSHSEFKQLEGVYLQPMRFAKTNLKSTSHDPITGSFSSYTVDRPKPRPLGSKPPEVFPGKILDSPPQVEYELPKHTKKAPKNQIFNPLTFETQNIKIERKKFQGLLMPNFNHIDEDPRLTDKIGKVKTSPDPPVHNPPPIYKGMGYKKSSIFT